MKTVNGITRNSNKIALLCFVNEQVFFKEETPGAGENSPLSHGAQFGEMYDIMHATSQNYKTMFVAHQIQHI